MKAAALAWLLVLSFCCAGSSVPPLVEPAAIKSPKVMSIIGRFGFGHACPVAGRIITAEHVAYVTARSGADVGLYYSYQQGGKRGYLSTVIGLGSRDLALMQVDAGDAPTFNDLSQSKPRPGDKVSWYEYSFDARVLAMQVVQREAKVLRTVSGHVVFSPNPVQGASGSCIFDADGDVVGIVSWGIPTKGGLVGVGPLIVGEWKPF